MINAQGIMTNREFVSMVRAKLDSSGHRDIAVERCWIDEETPGEPFLLHVPVGAELRIALKPTAGMFNKPAADADLYVGQFAAALVNLRSAEKALIRYVRDMRRAAALEISAARAHGLDLHLVEVGLAPTYAAHLTGKSWKDAADHVVAAVIVRHTSFYLRPTTTSIVVGDVEELADELSIIREDQSARQQRLRELSALGADLEVDALTLALLQEHGLDAATVLRDVWKRQCVNLTVDHMGRKADLSLIASSGKVEASLLLEEVVWNGEHLWFREEAMFHGHGELVGKSLGDRVPHPILAKQRVIEVISGPDGRDLVHLDVSGKLLFDADTGRLWRDGRLEA